MGDVICLSDGDESDEKRKEIFVVTDSEDDEDGDKLVTALCEQLPGMTADEAREQLELNFGDVELAVASWEMDQTRVHWGGRRRKGNKVVDESARVECEDAERVRQVTGEDRKRIDIFRDEIHVGFSVAIAGHKFGKEVIEAMVETFGAFHVDRRVTAVEYAVEFRIVTVRKSGSKDVGNLHPHVVLCFPAETFHERICVDQDKESFCTELKRHYPDFTVDIYIQGAEIFCKKAPASGHQSPSVWDRLNEATAWLFLEYGISCYLGPTNSKTCCTYLSLRADLLAAARYCSPKTSLERTRVRSTNRRFTPLLAESCGFDDLTRSYANFLGTIPGVSVDVVKAVIARYPTLHTLYDAFESSSAPQTLLAHLLIHDHRRIGECLARKIWQVLCSKDPNLVIQ